VTELRLVAVVGDHLRHRWSAGELASDPHFRLAGVVSERQPPQPEGRPGNEQELVSRHFAARREAEERHFGAAPGWGELGTDVVEVAHGEANGTDVFEWVTARQADFLLTYGCSIIRPPLLDAFAGRTVNVHLGLSPYYRGHGTNFWPLVNGEPECVGATVHLATADVDAGPVLRQARPAMAADDGQHDIGCKALAAGVDALRDVLPAFAAGRVEPVPQASGGRVYRRRDFEEQAAEALTTLRERFEAGLIAAYLAEKPARDARFPIVE
jgi:methionyl-tRNA formyltransferase